MKIKVTCNHLYLNGAMVFNGDILDIDNNTAKSIIDSDTKAKRKPRIKVLETIPAPRKRKVVKNESIAKVH